MMNEQRFKTVLVAIEQAARPYGIKRLAVDTHQNIGTLRNKINPDDPQPLSLRDFCQTVYLTGDLRPIKSLAAMFDLATFHMPDHRATSDADLVASITAIAKENGEFQQAIADGLAARRFEQRNFETVRAEAMDTVAEIFECLNRLRGLIDE